MGPVEDEASVVYFRPETAQGSYVNFKNVQQSSRKKIPFGIAQIGKSFRNEISPGNFVFRMREFEQMEMQYFVRPDEAARDLRGVAARGAGTGTSGTASRRSASASASTPRTSSPTTRRRRSTSSTASRSAGRSSRASTTGATSTCRAHAKASGENLEYFDPATEEHFIPWIVETAGGAGPGGVHVPHRRLSRGGGPRREAGRPRVPPGARAVQGRGAAAAQEAAGDRRDLPPAAGRPRART